MTNIHGVRRPLLYGILTALIVFISLSLQGQNAKQQRQTDSLKQLLQTELPDTSRFEVFSHLSRLYSRIQPATASYYSHQNIKLTEGQSDISLSARAWGELSSVYYFSGQLDSLQYARQRALYYLDQCESKECQSIFVNVQVYYAFSYNDHGQPQKAIDIASQLLQLPELTLRQKFRIHNSLGQFFIERADYDSALKHAQQIFELNKTEKDELIKSYRLKITFDCYVRLAQWDKAEATALESVAVSRKINLTSRLQYALYNIAQLYTTQGEIIQSLPYYKELLTLSTKDAPEVFYSHALIGIIEASPIGDPEAVAYVTELKEILESDQSFRVIHVRRGIYNALSKYYLRSGENELAEFYAHGHLRFIRQHQKDTAELLTNALESLNHVQASIGKYEEAWHTYDTLHQLKMILVQRNQEEALAKTSVEMSLSENDLARQNAEQATLLEQQASFARTRLFMFLLAIAGFLLAGAAWAYRRAQRDKRIIGEQKELVQQSLAEKEVLLREIHHRVKNNLQIISSLLDKQARKSPDKTVQKLVKEGKERIQSMALIHQNLYESDQLSGINIKSYLQELGKNIQKSQLITAGQVELELNVVEEKLDIDTAIPVGLILNELLTNCYKYAFAQKDKGKITVDFKRQGEQYFLQVSDNGIGFPPEQAQQKTRSLGLSLVNGLVRQLEGTIEWLSVAQGATVAIRF